MVSQITVVIPTYNRERLTDGAIESVCTNEPLNTEIVIVDDCSEQEYRFAGDNNKYGVPVRILRLNKNMGPGMARKEGVRAAQGNYIMFLDADDRLDGGWIDWVAGLVGDEGEFGDAKILLAGNVEGMGLTARCTISVLGWIPEQWVKAVSKIIAVGYNPFCTTALVVHRELCEFLDGARFCEDYYTALVALYRADAVVVTPRKAGLLGRPQKSHGGESAEWRQMFRGEMRVRIATLNSNEMSLIYRLLVPVGICYQVCREVVKLLGRLPGVAAGYRRK
jgi:glycosyltransferase involved in cell wall biosynthesis